jgi:hypothetical protein
MCETLTERELGEMLVIELSRARSSVFCRSDFHTVQGAAFKEKVFICVRRWARGYVPPPNTHTHTHIHIYIYMYILYL